MGAIGRLPVGTTTRGAPVPWALREIGKCKNIPHKQVMITHRGGSFVILKHWASLRLFPSLSHSSFQDKQASTFYPMHRILFFLLAIGLPAIAGEKRTWTNAEGTKRFDAEFVSRDKDTITVLPDGGKELAFDIAKLSEDDRRWINLHFPLDAKGKGEAMPDATAVFDTLEFGDSRETVSQKLRDSKIVQTAVSGVFQGRTGLNGIYRTRHLVGGLYCYLYFDWTENGGLKEITLQTESQLLADYPSKIKSCWSDLIEPIVFIHGKPSQATDIAKPEKLGDGQILVSHLWSIEQGGSAMLGTAREGDEYQVIVRFTREKIAASVLP